MSQVEHISPAQAAAPSTEQAEPSPPELSHFGLFWRFLKFGTFAFGGPVAQIAMIRRELVDEEALKVRLKTGALAAAGFDVFAVEPPVDLELIRLPNFLATQHIGGSSEEAVLAMGRRSEPTR